MKSNEMSFEEINQHIANADIKEFEPGGKSHFTASMVATQPGSVLQKLCGAFKVIRPILMAISSFPLLPPSWRQAIKVFISLMDTLCP